MTILLLFFTVGLVLVWFLIRMWYFRQVTYARAQVQHRDGRSVPGQAPRLLVGNLVDVYRAKNRLSAYDSFHEKLGEIVQIFWLWRQQISVTDYRMARQILVTNQKNYRKYPPNWLIRRLYGSSVLTNNGDDWKRHRVVLNQVFSKKHIAGFYDIFVAYSEQLASKWERYLEKPGESAPLDIYPDLIALALDIVGKAALGYHFGALSGETDELLEHLNYVLNQSTRPVHQFTTWWRHLPLSSNRRLAQALEFIDDFHNELICQRKALHEQSRPDSANVLDLLLQATDSLTDDGQPLTEKEVRDNLLALIVNGYETTATTVSLALYLLARHPDHQAQAQAEVDRAMQQGPGRLSAAGVAELHYLDGVVNETLRLYPAMAGLQRVSVAGDVLADWSIPAQQVVGITLRPLHLNPHYFGHEPEQFRPERYLEPDQSPILLGQHALEAETPGKCPVHHQGHQADRDDPKAIDRGVCLPLTFGAGPRQCLGEAFARYEMKVVLAVLLYRFNFQVAPNFEVDMELGKFGLFVTMLPQQGVQLLISPRQ